MKHLVEQYRQYYRAALQRYTTDKSPEALHNLAYREGQLNGALMVLHGGLVACREIESIKMEGSN